MTSNVTIPMPVSPEVVGYFLALLSLILLFRVIKWLFGNSKLALMLVVFVFMFGVAIMIGQAAGSVVRFFGGDPCTTIFADAIDWARQNVGCPVP